jgi:hypothetical protein
MSLLNKETMNIFTEIAMQNGSFHVETLHATSLPQYPSFHDNIIKTNIKKRNINY